MDSAMSGVTAMEFIRIGFFATGHAAAASGSALLQ
jgi:hypothetical protein